MDFDIGSKYRQMKRAYDKLETIGTNTGSSITNVDAKDAAEEFFTQCYHFKDWLKKAYPALNRTVEQYISNSLPLSLAADFCNTFKHAGLDSNPRLREHLATINTHIKMDFTPQGIVASSHIEIKTPTRSFNGLDIAGQCIQEWDKFIQNNNVVIPSP